MFRPIAFLVVVKEEKVCQANVEHVCVVVVLLHKVQSLLSTVSSPEECLGDLPRPAGPRVALDRENVQLLPACKHNRQAQWPNLPQTLHSTSLVHCCTWKDTQTDRQRSRSDRTNTVRTNMYPCAKIQYYNCTVHASGHWVSKSIACHERLHTVSRRQEWLLVLVQRSKQCCLL